MALDYTLHIKSKYLPSGIIERYLFGKNVFQLKPFEENCFNLFDELGFIVSISSVETVFFEFLVDENKSVEDNWDYSTNIHFRLDKFYDNFLVRLNMIDFCINLLNSIEEDAKFIFNGDILVFERNNGLIKINWNFGFWNSKELLEKSRNL